MSDVVSEAVEVILAFKVLEKTQAGPARMNLKQHIERLEQLLLKAQVA